jgi:hypothetical protein
LIGISWGKAAGGTHYARHFVRAKALNRVLDILNISLKFTRFWIPLLLYRHKLQICGSDTLHARLLVDP